MRGNETLITSLPSHKLRSFRSVFIASRDENKRTLNDQFRVETNVTPAITNLK